MNIFMHMRLVPNLMKYSKTCVKRPLSKDQNLVFKTNYCLIQVKSIAEYILQYFQPSLSYNLSLRSCLSILSDCLTQVLL